MASINYKETELWQQAKDLLTATYRLTKGWPEDGKDLAGDIRTTARQIVRAVPTAFKKGGITGNMHLRLSGSHFGEFGALCEVAEALGFVESGALLPLIELCAPVEAKFRELAKASQVRARELMKNRTRIFGGLNDDDDEEF